MARRASIHDARGVANAERREQLGVTLAHVDKIRVHVERHREANRNVFEVVLLMKDSQIVSPYIDKKQPKNARNSDFLWKIWVKDYFADETKMIITTNRQRSKQNARYILIKHRVKRWLKQLHNQIMYMFQQNKSSTMLC